jgi:glycosyltransferase involved in cell wall biosynthesis
MDFLKNSKKELDVIIYKRESFDSDRLRDDVASYTGNFIFLLFDAKGISCTYSPPGVKIIKTRINFLSFKNRNLYYLFYPLVFLVDNIRIFKLFFIICLRFRVKIIFMETYSAAFVGILRRCNLVKRTIYVTTDWFQGNKNKRGIWSGFGSNLFFPLFDYMACKLNDITLNLTELQSSARYKFWGRKIARREMLFMHHLEIKNKSEHLNNPKNKIVFIGEVRSDSGLGLVIKSLGMIRKRADFSLKIIGPANALHKDLKAIAKRYDVESYVEFLGFVERINYEKALSDCLLGVNLITQKDTFTEKSIPSKIFDYLQYLLPVIATVNIGGLTSVVSENRLGSIIKPTEVEFTEAVIKIYEERGQFVNNIIRFIHARPYTNLKDLFVDVSLK